MGGIGSGRYYRRSSRTTCEEVRRIDIRYLRKQGLLRPGSAGTLSWKIGDEPNGSIRYTMHHSEMQLKFNCRWYDEDWQEINQTIPIVITPCNYGGFRKWFRCPHCNTRIAILYHVNQLFLCRHCYNLPYASQGEGYMDRMSRKADKLSKKLEADEYTDDGDLYKPKGMHWRTFYNLKMAEIAADEKVNNAFLVRFGHWL